MSSSQRPPKASIAELLANFRAKHNIPVKLEVERVSKDLQEKIEGLEKGLAQLKKQQVKDLTVSHSEFMTPRKRIKAHDYGVESTKLNTAVSVLRNKSVATNEDALRCAVSFKKPLTTSKFNNKQLKPMSSMSSNRNLLDEYNMSSSNKPFVPLRSIAESKKLLFF